MSSLRSHCAYVNPDAMIGMDPYATMVSTLVLNASSVMSDQTVRKRATRMPRRSTKKELLADGTNRRGGKSPRSSSSEGVALASALVSSFLKSLVFGRVGEC